MTVLTNTQGREILYRMHEFDTREQVIMLIEVIRELASENKDGCFGKHIDYLTEISKGVSVSPSMLENLDYRRIEPIHVSGLNEPKE